MKPGPGESPRYRAARHTRVALCICLGSLIWTGDLATAPAKGQTKLEQELERSRKEQLRVEEERRRVARELERSKARSRRLAAARAEYEESLNKSLLLPGRGQWESGRRTSGAIFAGLFALFGWQTYAGFRDWRQASEEYEDVAVPAGIIGAIREPSALVVVAALFDERRARLTETRAAFDLSVLLWLVSYAANVYDVYRNAPRPDADTQATRRLRFALRLGRGRSQGGISSTHSGAAGTGAAAWELIVRMSF